MTTIVIHTENKKTLIEFFNHFNQNFQKNKFKLLLHSKNYYPWEDEFLLNEITSFDTYYCYPTTKSKITSIIELVYKVNSENFILIDEETPLFSLNKNTVTNFNYLLTTKKNFLNKNLDTKYETTKWFIVDVVSQIIDKKIEFNDNNNDSIRYNSKINDDRFFQKIIHIDGGLGDHVMALPLIKSLSKNIFVSCKYPNILNHLDIKGFIDWNDELFGGYERFVYEYGSNNNCKKIIDSFFEMYGYKRKESDILKYNGNFESNNDIITSKKIALICPSAAKIQGLDSNKDWKDVRWLNLVNELQKRGYYVIQVGTTKDTQIPNVNLKFLDKPIQNIAALIRDSSLWISVDTFFHHFASSIKPDVGVCLTPFYNDHAKHLGVTYIEKDCGKNYSDRRWWLDLQQPERKECMDLITVDDVVSKLKIETTTNKVALVCIAKNEDNYIDEWIDYHKKIGFDDIFVYQNDWYYDIKSNNVKVIKYDGQNRQLYAYNDFIENYHDKYEWAAFFDCDEFLVLKKHESIKKFLDDYSNFDSVVINWVLFGDNGLEKINQNNFSVLERFTKRQNKVNPHVKSIVKLKKGVMFVHNPHVVDGISWVDANYNIGSGAINPSGNDDIAQLSHYFCKTKEEFDLKSNRGRADNGSGRTFEEFMSHNLNEIYDFTAFNFSANKVGKKFVEFIIPTYDRIYPLKSMLSSLMAQTDGDWSANVVIDDVSNDEITNLIKEFKDDRLYFTFAGKRYNDFGHTPREIGKNLSIAKYIILTGDDNYYTPNFVEELKKNSTNNPVMIYWDMVHNHKHYATDTHYSYWKTLLVNCGIDMGSFATRGDVLKKYTLENNNFCADGKLVENILNDNSSNYPIYMNIINQMVREKDFSKPIIDIDNVTKIDKVLYVHN